MTKILLVRHGESDANLKDVFAGHYDADLTVRGLAQAEHTAAFIKGTYAVDAVYSSDLRRAYKTAKPIADAFGLPIIATEGMREIAAGEWEGVPFYGIKDTHPELFHTFLYDLGNAVCPQGESVVEMAERVVQTITCIATENEGKTVVIATHATPIRALQCCFSGQPLSYIQQIPWVSNASVTEIHYENGCFTVEKVSQDAHLADMRTTLPTDI